MYGKLLKPRQSFRITLYRISPISSLYWPAPLHLPECWHRTFSSGIHTHPVSWNCPYHLPMELSDGGCFPNLVRNLLRLVACDMYVRCSTLSSALARVTRERQGASLLLLLQQATLQFGSQVGNLHVRPDTRPLYKLLKSHNHHPVSQSTKHKSRCKQRTFDSLRIPSRRVFHVQIQLYQQTSPSDLPWRHTGTSRGLLTRLKICVRCGRLVEPHSGRFSPGKDFLYQWSWLGGGHGLDGCGEQKITCPHRVRTPNLPACSKLRPHIKSLVMTRFWTSNCMKQNFLQTANVAYLIKLVVVLRGIRRAPST